MRKIYMELSLLVFCFFFFLGIPTALLAETEETYKGLKIFSSVIFDMNLCF